MISRYEAYMDGIPMSSLSPQILITDVQHTPAEYQTSVNRITDHNGGIIFDRYLATASVTIVFAIREYDIFLRQNICDTVNKWANGTYLETNDKPGRKLACVCDRRASIRSALKWSETMSITFTAHEVPYWVDKDVSSSTLSDGNTTGTLDVPGNIPDLIPVDVTVTANATITSLTVTCGSSSITLSGISVPNSQTVVFSHDSNGVLAIMNGTTSLLSKVTSASSDDLMIGCGNAQTIGVTASASVSATFSVRGCWL